MKIANGKSHPRPSVRSNPRPSAKDSFVGSAVRAVLQLVVHARDASGSAPRRALIVRYLRGFASNPVLPTVLDAVPEFGVFHGLPNAWVERLIDGLIDEGYLEVDLEDKGQRGDALRSAPLFLAERGRLALKSPSSLEVGPFLPTPDGEARARLRDSDPCAGAVEDGLTQLRAQLARGEGRPAFSVLPNDVIAALVRIQPGDLGGLAGVRGMGVERVRKYGRKILNAIRKAKK
jgi:ATP-dependent DNA helicase RecQ